MVNVKYSKCCKNLNNITRNKYIVIRLSTDSKMTMKEKDRQGDNGPRLRFLINIYT